MKKIYYVLLLMFISQGVFAQLPDDVMQRGKDVLSDLMNARGEKIYEQLNGEMKAAITVPQLNLLWSGLSMQLGECEKVDDWKGQLMGDNQVVTSRLHFKNQPLLFLVSFNKGEINGLRVTLDPNAEAKEEKAESASSFEEKEVKVTTRKFTLPGFLTVPRVGGNFPCVVLVHGSGATDRNESIGENRPFKNLAHGLAEHGIATLRYDKRAFVYKDKSVPEGEELNLRNEVIDDALSAVKLACSENNIDSTRVFVLGHSLGAMLAPRMATLCPQLKGIIMMAGNARPFDEIFVEQIVYLDSLGLASGFGDQLEELKKQFSNVYKFGTPEYDPAIKSPLNQPVSYWQDFNNYHQTEVAKTVSLPIFILNGERDYNVTMTDFNIWKKELAGKKNVSFKSYPTLNHLFMESSEKPTPKDYATPRHIPEYVINDVANWIKKQK